jgi:hypothetical protein
MYKKALFAVANSLIWTTFVAGGYVQSMPADPGDICHSILQDVRDGRVNPNMTPSQMDQCAIKYPSSSTDYEEFLACGYNTPENEFNCVVKIKKDINYDGKEYVGVCVDSNLNGRFEANELSNIGNVYVTTAKNPPWNYSVIVANSLSLRNGQTYQAKAILSWNNSRITCDTRPYSGNVINFQIRPDKLIITPPCCKPCTPSTQALSAPCLPSLPTDLPTD